MCHLQIQKTSTAIMQQDFEPSQLKKKLPSKKQTKQKTAKPTPQENPNVSGLLDVIVVYTTVKVMDLQRCNVLIEQLESSCSFVEWQVSEECRYGGKACAVLLACSVFPWYNYISSYHHWPSSVTLYGWDCQEAGDQPSNHVSQSCTSADAEQVSCHMCWLFEMLLLSDNLQQQNEIPSTSTVSLQQRLCLPFVNIKQRGVWVFFFPLFLFFFLPNSR